MSGVIDAKADPDYWKYANDVDFDPRLDSSSAAYVHNADDGGKTYGEDRWRSGGGIQTGDCDKPGLNLAFGDKRAESSVAADLIGKL